MPAATLAASSSVIATSPGSYTLPSALQQLLHKIEEQCHLDPRASEFSRLKADLESRWRIASSEGHASSTMLYEILEYGWKQWLKIAT